MAAAGQGRRAAFAPGRAHGPARGPGGGRARRRGARRPVTLLVGSAFVTGGGSGIGRAIAQALAAQGAAVAVMDVLPDGGKDTVGAIATKGGRATFVQGDVSRWDDVDRAIAAAVRELGPLGIMVNAAGVLDGYAPADEIGSALWERVLGADAPVMRGVGGDEAAVRAITPAGRRGTLDEIAAAACYLASAEADYVTGSTLVVDGGWTAR